MLNAGEYKEWKTSLFLNYIATWLHAKHVLTKNHSLSPNSYSFQMRMQSQGHKIKYNAQFHLESQM